MENQEVETVEFAETTEGAGVEEHQVDGFDYARALVAEIFFDLALVMGKESVAAIKMELRNQFAGQEDLDEKALVAQSIYNACELCQEFYEWENQL